MNENIKKKSIRYIVFALLNNLIFEEESLDKTWTVLVIIIFNKKFHNNINKEN